MREAVGNTFIFNVVIIFTLIVIFLLIGSLGYSKGFKAKNKIIRVIEDNRGFNDNASEEIHTILRNLGFRPRSVFRSTCPSDIGTEIANSDDYLYCVYENTTDKGNYFTVLVYIRFEIPIFNEILEFPVRGDTKTIYDYPS